MKRVEMGLMNDRNNHHRPWVFRRAWRACCGVVLAALVVLTWCGAGESRAGRKPSEAPSAVVAAEPARSAASWPRWRGVAGAGVWTPPSDPPELSLQDGLPLVWKQPLGPGYSGIAVADGRVYTQDRPPDVPGQERVLCWDQADGKLLWEHRYDADYGKLDYGKGPRATPLVDDGRVYTFGAVGHFECLDAKSGERLFGHDVKTAFGARQPEWGFAASPIRYRDMIVLHVGAADGSFLALDRLSGELRWRSGTDPCGYATPILISHAGQDVLVGWTPERVVAMEPATGRELWSIPYVVTYGVSIAGPLFREGLVFVSGYWEGTKAIRLGAGPEDATVAWEENRQLRGLMSEPLYRDGHVYLLDKYFGIVCCELASGRVLWVDRNQLTPADRNPQASLVWVGDSDRVLALNAEGELVLARFTPASYEELGRTKLVGPTWAHPAYVGPHVFARDDEQIAVYRLVP